MPKSATEQLNAPKSPKIVILEKPFGGVKVGEKMFVATPQIVNDYIKAIPYGQTKTIANLKDDLAHKNECVGTCPMSTAIFVRICSQAAIDEMAAGKALQDIVPFWRLISSKDKVAAKLSIDKQWLDSQREIEASNRH